MTKFLIVLALSIATASVAQARQGELDDQNGQEGQDSQDEQRESPHEPTVTAPEIDPGSATSALTLLAGGLAVIRGRRSKQ